MEVESESESGKKGKPAGRPPEMKATFKEKVLGVEASKPKKIVDLVKEGVMKLDLVDENRLFPCFDFVEEADYDRICKPFEDCLVIKLLGKRIGYGALTEKLRSMWKLTGGYTVKDVHHGYFLIKFDHVADKEKVVSGAPWLIYDHYLSIQPWTPDFVAADAKVNTTLVWIRIPGLGFQFYDESILCTLATAVGTPIKVDMNTVDMECGKFARICVEIDLNQPVVGRIRLRKTWYNVEYEGLHLLCSTCGCYGHMTRNCTQPVPQSKATEHTATTSSGNAEKVCTAAMAAAKIPGAAETLAAAAETLEAANFVGDKAMMEGVISGPVIKPIQCPETAHGDWLVVEKRKKNLKKPINASSKQTDVEKVKATKKGNNHNEPMPMPKSAKSTSTGVMQFTAGVNFDPNTYPMADKNGKKRTRKDPAINGGSVRPMVQHIAPPTKATPKLHQATSSSKGTTAVVIGGNQIFTLENGVCSTMNLEHQGGSRYSILEENNQEQQGTGGTSMLLEGGTPFDPGELVPTRSASRT
ncbi:uncharacterized protein LOC130743650 [Lotus japonicus]|uniref:uncharacterized protein LOC130743650 n=1 Tax=Lotus japonicus TaxID=34305 RepID=UPI002589A68B|nr:uncharacterized protein LOC130743650 [Lotus japonicus]